MLILRAHHVLCIQGYRQKGYSKEFVKNMNNIVEKFKYNPIIKIIVRTDGICSACPHNKNNYCDHQEYINYLDEQVLKVLDIKENDMYLYEEILEKIAFHIDEKAFEKICSKCAWYSLGYCREGILNLNRKNS